MNTCTIPGCRAKRCRYGTMCGAHTMRRRRHGHALQSAVTKAQLMPHRKTVEAFLDAKPDRWPAVEAVWHGLHARMEALVEERESQGRWIADAAYRAAKAVCKVAIEADTREIVATVMAVAYASREDPGLFRDDRAIVFQMARRFRGLAEVNIARYRSSRTGKEHRVYREIPAAESEALGKVLMVSIGVYGLGAHAAIQRRRAAEQEARERAWEAMEDA